VPQRGENPDSSWSFDPLPAHDEHTMPDEHFETMGIATGPDSSRESGRWHGDKGEGIGLWVAHRERQDGMVLPTRWDRTDATASPHPKVLHAGQDQAHHNKHFAHIRLPERLWQDWVFHISDSKRRRTARCSDHHRLRSVVCRAGNLVASTCQRGFSWGVD